VVMTNGGGEGADDLGFHLLNDALPLTPAPSKHTEIALPADVLEKYVGTYALSPQFQLVITRNADELWVQPTAQPNLRLWPESETQFFLKEVDAQITFTLDANGKVTGLVLHQRGRDMPGRKTK